MATDIRNPSQPHVSVEHIELNDKGVAKLVGHRIKVKDLVATMQFQGYTTEQLHSEAYPHLSRAQVHAALAYYYDHRAEIDDQIRRDNEFADEMRAKLEPQSREALERMRARAPRS
jgi:uncharacterized protein (DUF433 family)